MRAITPCTTRAEKPRPAAFRRRRQRAYTVRGMPTVRLPSALGALLVAVAGAASSCGADGIKEETFIYTEGQEEDFGFADAPPRVRKGGAEELSPGDRTAFGTSLVDSRGSEVGRLDIECTVTTAGTFGTSNGHCSGTASIPGGTLAVSFGGKIGGATNGAILGGTGDYDGASGSFRSTEERKGRPTVDTFRVKIPVEE